MFRESLDSAVRQTWNSYLLSSLSLTQTAKRPTSCAGCDKEGRCFLSMPIQVLNKNPSLRIVDLKKNNITEEGALMLAEAPCGLNGKREKKSNCLVM